ncbi:MAG TPA: Flp family type IVb pilin [Allosphingosinicella sp.]|nr:Flp family type IVb pilin [Allosphingosinicella sp.]
MFHKLLKNKKGATAIEYGLIAALIAIAAITAMTALGGELNETFTKVDTSLDSANKNPAPAAD